MSLHVAVDWTINWAVATATAAVAGATDAAVVAGATGAAVADATGAAPDAGCCGCRRH